MVNRNLQHFIDTTFSERSKEVFYLQNNLSVTGAKILPFARGGWRGFDEMLIKPPLPLLAKEGIIPVTEGLFHTG